MIFVILFFLCCQQAVIHCLVVNNKTVVSYGGPKTYVVTDRYNEVGDWNRTYYSQEPQQIHATWISDGMAFTVQFSTMRPVIKALLWYWPKEKKEEGEEFIQDSLVRKKHLIKNMSKWY